MSGSSETNKKIERPKIHLGLQESSESEASDGELMAMSRNRGRIGNLTTSSGTENFSDTGTDGGIDS